MPQPKLATAAKHLRASDLRGAGRLAIDATLGLTSLVENLHSNIASLSLPLGKPVETPTSGITGLVYRSVRGVTKLVGGSLDALLGALAAVLERGPAASSPEREAVLAALNGVLGDHLAASGNPLALAMRLLRDGRPLDSDHFKDMPDLQPRVMLRLHGLCMNPLQWRHEGRDPVAELAAEGGFTLLDLHYNTGLHISSNGRELADRLQAVQAAWPLPLDEWVIVVHSMGGLVARSAVHQARARGDTWSRLVTKLICIGTPHHGAPLERGGHWIDALLGKSPYSAAFARLGKIRSAGITDLRHGSVLDADWQSSDRFAASHHDTRTPVPLPEAVDCYAIAGSLGLAPGDLRTQLLGDGIVPLASALGQHRQAARRLHFAPDHQWIGQGLNHLELMYHADVGAQLRRWLLPAQVTAAPA